MKIPFLPTLSSDHAPLAETLDVLASRRRLLLALGASGALAVLPWRANACALIPSETAGPYPGDGTNGPNVLTQSGVLRSDIRASFGSAGTATAPGTRMTITLKLVSTTSGCAPLAGLAVYLWHCNATGGYSLYSSGVTNQNYLRGVQVSDANGEVTFTTIFPGCYPGRWPHIHFEVYGSAAEASSGRNAIRTSQLALPEAPCRTVYAQASYGNSQSNLNGVTLASDGIFAEDRAVLQLATTSGDNTNGYVAALEVGIAATPAALDPDQHGLTGTWFESATSGQGFSLEVYPDAVGAGIGSIFGGWFTYDVAPAGGAEKQRWYTFGGDVARNATASTLAIYRNTGGTFDAPPTTSAEVVGAMIVRFTTCTTGQVDYAFTDGSGRSGSIPISRVASNVTCSAGSDRPTNADFALSGSWYAPATAGQGFIVEVNPNARALVFCWYTYAINGQSLGVSGQRWYTAQGTFTAGQRSIDLVLYETTGGIFDTPTPGSQSTTPVGTARLAFASCAAASLGYAFTSGANAGLAGTIALSRVGPVAPGCAG